MSGDTVAGGTDSFPSWAEWSALTPDPPARPTTTPDDVPWTLSYDRSSVDRFFADAQAERARLQGQIEAAHARVEAARRATAARQAEVQGQLGALVLVARGDLERIDREHQQILVTIRAAAETEAARVLAAAQREAAAIRSSTASLAALLSGGGAPAPPPEAAETPRPAERHDRGAADAG